MKKRFLSRFKANRDTSKIRAQLISTLSIKDLCKDFVLFEDIMENIRQKLRQWYEFIFSFQQHLISVRLIYLLLLRLLCLLESLLIAMVNVIYPERATYLYTAL